jgi:hypothetical protein
MKQNEDKTSNGLNQIFEIINAKGDLGEINKILKDEKNREERDRNVEKST